MRDILRQAEGFFRKDAQDARKQEQEGRIPELQERLKVLEGELEVAIEEVGWIPDELDQKYQDVRLELDKILHGHIEVQREGHEISPEWTALQQALHGQKPSKTPNLRLVIDAIDRLKAEGEWDESLLSDESTSQQAAK